MISVFIVEDDNDIRESLALIIDNNPGFLCVGTAADGETAHEEIPAVQPDVLLMDITLPGMTGIDCVRQLKAALPELNVLMLTVHEDDDLVFDSLCAGACGYLTKNTSPEKLLDAIREVHAGGAPMSTTIARMVVTSFRQKEHSDLTQRESDVLSQLCKGKSYKMISDALFISHDTVRTHIKNIYRKLEVSSKSEAILAALKTRMVR